MLSSWKDEAQKETVNIVGVLCGMMFVAWLELPENATYPLLNFPVPMKSFFYVMTVFLGTFLFYQMLSRLPVGKDSRVVFRDHSLVWLVIFPAVYGWFLFLVALDVTYPFIDMAIVPLFAAGFCGIIAWYLNYLSGGRFLRGLKRTAHDALVWTQGKVGSAGRFIYQVL